MKTLEDFKEGCPESWKIYGPASKIIAAAYFHKDSTIKELATKLNELEKGDLIAGIKFLQDKKEITLTENSKGRKYNLTQKTRETFKGLYRNVLKNQTHSLSLLSPSSFDDTSPFP